MKFNSWIVSYQKCLEYVFKLWFHCKTFVGKKRWFPSLLKFLKIQQQWTSSIGLFELNFPNKKVIPPSADVSFPHVWRPLSPQKKKKKTLTCPSKKFSLWPQLSIRGADIWSTFYGAPVTATDKIGRKFVSDFYRKWQGRHHLKKSRDWPSSCPEKPAPHETDRHPRYELSINVNVN